MAQTVSISAGPVASSGLSHSCTGCASHQGAGPAGIFQLCIQKSVSPAVVALHVHATNLLIRVFAVAEATICLWPVMDSFLQVSKVFNIYTDTTPLRVALVTGQKSLAKEQETLVQKT